MKRIFFGGILLTGLLVGCSPDRAELAALRSENARLSALVAPPPASLDSLFPPHAQGPAYLMSMIDMAMPLTGVFVDLMQGDMENVSGHYERFKAKYAEVAALVPEWESAFPMEPVEELGGLLQSGDQDRILEVAGRIGAICQDCHLAQIPKVQQRYHWPAFSDVAVTDPTTGGEISFKDLMSRIQTAFDGIGIDLQEGQPDNAVRQVESFESGYELMKETCVVCHDTERAYYVDAAADAAVAQLGALVRSGPADAQAVQELTMRIGMETCFNCHLVHIPAAYAKAVWAGSSPVAQGRP